MTEDDLAQIEARATAATPGPWAAAWAPGEHMSVGTEDEDILFMDGPRLDDAQFIAHARQDIPALLDEVRQLRKKLDWWEANPQHSVLRPVYHALPGSFEMDV